MGSEMSRRQAVAFALALLGTATVASAPPAGARTRTGSCAPAGTAGSPDLPPGGTDGFAALLPAPAGTHLPDHVRFRNTLTTFNRLWWFALANGRVYAKPAGADGDWRVVPVPACLDGGITGISADDDELVAADAQGRLFTMDHAMNGPRWWNWTSRFGAPVWLGGGNTLPGRTLDWSWSVISPAEDERWTDGVGNVHGIEPAKVSHVHALTGDGSRITYLDPWLPDDHSYQLRTPVGGRFQAVRLSASGSTVFVTNRYGDMYTRLYDFDMSGANTVVFRYSYEDQSDLPTAPDLVLERIDPHYAAVQLPAQDWVHQPKVPGQITDLISIHKSGPGSDARELRVEGVKDGVTGLWRKGVRAPEWSFLSTGDPLQRPLLDNSPEDRSADTLAPPSPFSYAGSGEKYSAEVSGFQTSTGATPLDLRFHGGAALRLSLHTVDPLRQFPRADGLDGSPRAYDGALEVSRELLDSLSEQPREVRDFVTGTLGARRFTTTDVQVSTGSLRIPALGLSLFAR
ncbi:hypothetical protein ACWC4D_41425 [Streptomyces sp. NPDC001288]|uniref:hypothetical protein n=1 Tax=Streptomyces sp. NPDC001297 TaxID=3364559 RepID=UPI0036B22185